MKQQRQAMVFGLYALAQFLVDEGTPEETQLSVTELAREATAADFASTYLMMEGQTAKVADVGAEFSRPNGVGPFESSVQDSPGLEAFEGQIAVHVECLADEARWPGCVSEWIRWGMRTSLSLPMSTERHRLGALTMCSRRLGAFDAEGIASAEIFARQAAVVLRNTQVYADATQLNVNLRFALESRSTIDHAVGIMMAGGGRTAEDTFQSLVHASQRENRKIRDLAAEIVDRAEHRTRSTGRSEPRLVHQVDVAGVPVDVA